MTRRCQQTAIYYAAGALQGFCLVLVPAGSFLWKSPLVNGLNDQQYGALFLPIIVGAVVSSVALQRLVRSVGGMRMYLGSLLCGAVYLLILMLMTHAAGNAGLSFRLLFVGCAFLGCLIGWLGSLLNWYIIELYPEHRGSALTGLHGCITVGASIAPLTMSACYQAGAWVMSPVLAFIALLMVAWLSCVTGACRGHAVFAPEAAATAASARVGWGRLSRGTRGFLALMLLYGCVEGVLANWTTSYLYEERGMSVQAASMALASFWGAVTCGRFGLIGILPRVRPEWLYRMAPAAIAAGLVCVLSASQARWLVAYYALLGLGCSYFFPLSVGLSTSYEESAREPLSSYSIAALMIGIGIGSVLVGWLREYHGLTLHGAFVAALACVGAMSVLAVTLTTARMRLRVLPVETDA